MDPACNFRVQNPVSQIVDPAGNFMVVNPTGKMSKLLEILVLEIMLAKYSK